MYVHPNVQSARAPSPRLLRKEITHRRAGSPPADGEWDIIDRLIQGQQTQEVGSGSARARRPEHDGRLVGTAIAASCR